MKNFARAAFVMIGVLVVAVPLGFADEPEQGAASKRWTAEALHRTLDTRALQDKADESDPGLGVEKRGFQPTKGSDDTRLAGIETQSSNGDGANPLGDDEDAELIVICHRPGTPGEHTLMVPPDALGGHLRHGDTEGPCPGDQSPTDNTAG